LEFRGGGTYPLIKSHCAFTLAEVLVTLGIIGVVSAMTLPTLVKNHQRQVYVTQLHKVYNEMSQAFEQVITDSNAVNLRESKYWREDNEWFFRNYFKTAKICSGNSVYDCFADEYKNMNGDVIRLRGFIATGGDEEGNGTSAILADGASVFIGGKLTVVTDINGKQGPNILGRDLFDFGLDENGNIYVEGDIEDLVSNFSTNCTSAVDQGRYGACLAKIINDGWKMDY